MTTAAAEAIDFAPLGLAIGHATDDEGATGLTVVRGTSGALHAGVAVLGRATGTRETLAARPEHLVDRVDAILLTGGSAYGLDAAAGVMRWMEERGRGFPVPGGVVPIVPAAVIFDLAPLGRYDARPTAAMAYAACESATSRGVAEGSVGAGAGATVGKAAGAAASMKGGLGCAIVRAGALVVGAIAVVNALGDVRDAAGRIIAGARLGESGFVDSARAIAMAGAEQPPLAAGAGAMQNTTIAVVATNAALSRQELAQLARAAGGALYRRITPTGTTYDGDVIFAVAPLDAAVQAPALQVEALAVAALEGAVERGVRTARGRDGIPGLGDGGRP